MNTNEQAHQGWSNRPRRDEHIGMAPLDIVMAEARRLRAQEMDRLLRAGLSRCKSAVVVLIAPIFGWNRRALDPDLRSERQASLVAYVKALRADAETGNKDGLLGHGA